MTELLSQTSLFAIVLTLLAVRFSLYLQKKAGGSALCNPILVSAILTISVLVLLGIPNQEYQAGCAGISWLLTPATICLAVPLYEQVQALKGHLKAIFAGIAAGTGVSIACISLMCLLFRLDRTLTVSLLPKSITTAMGIALSSQMGGMPAITTAAIAFTGIMANMTGESMCRLLKITEPIAQGTAFGTASHVIGTSRASQMSPLAGAVGSLSLVVAGILTALICPLL